MNLNKIIIFDFEVFRFDTLLGCLILENGTETYYQTWDIEEIKKFYFENKHNLWVGHNSQGYDVPVLQSIIEGKNPYITSKNIVEKNLRQWPTLDIIHYDVMDDTFFSLKMVEGCFGKDISETPVDFDSPIPLTEEEKRQEESYNRDDLDQTKLDFFDKDLMGKFKAKLELISLYGLSYRMLTKTGAQIAAKILGSKAIPGIEHMYIAPPKYPFLELKNEQLLNFYLNEDFRAGKKLTLSLCGLEHTFGAGGCHAGIKMYKSKKCMYFDVSGYYNLIMINLDLFPRTIPEKGKQLYTELYHTQLKYKITAPEKRAPLKIVLLAVWGSTLAKYSDFYDPQKGSLITITGQIFIADLLEKLENLVRCVQTNTDGIIVEPYNWDDEEKIMDIVKEWEKRTGFVIKKDEIFDVVQRDVNNYMYRDDKGKIHVKGEALKHYNSLDHIFGNQMFNAKEPVIIAKGIVNYFMENKLPEESVEENKENLRMFQQLCKKNSFDYLEYELVNALTGEVKVERLQKVNRAFAMKSGDSWGMVYKHKTDKSGKHSKAKVSSLPDSVFIYNNDINNEITIKKLSQQIDYQWYIDRIYERIGEFYKMPTIKEVKY